MMKRMSGEVTSKKYYIVYSICFMITIMILSIPFIKSGKGLIQYHDMLQQYYYSFEYFSDYLQNIIRTLWESGRLEIPMWDFGIGMGADVLTSLNYYVIGDPLNLIAVFFKNSQLEYVFHFLLILRVYLAGIAFSLFSRKIGYKKWYTLGATYVYIFSVYTLYSVFMYAAFINPFIYLPLILLGLEKVLRKESPILFVGSIFIALCSNFYFFYMLVILVVIYYLIRYVTINLKNQQKQKMEKKEILIRFLKDTIRIFVFALTGVLMSMVIFLPILIAFFNQGREAYSNLGNLFFYNLTEYMQLASSIISPKILKNYNLLGYSPIVIIAVVLLFRTKNSEKKEIQGLKIGVIILSLFLLIPFFSSMMNGFSYSNNRWLFGYAFLLAFIVECVLENLDNYRRKDYVYVGIVIIGYISLVLFFEIFQVKSVMIGALWLLITFITVLTGKERSRNRAQILAVLCIASCTYYGLYYYSEMSGFNMGQLIELGEADKQPIKTAAGGVKEIQDNEFYRVDVLPDEIKNEALVLGYYPTSFYYSLFPGNITQFNKELVNSQTTVANLQKGNSGRTYLNLLTNTKYVILDDKSQPVPYGYEYYGDYAYDSKNVQIYRNKNALPFGYTYDTYMSVEEYEKLDVEKKEEAMLQSAVLEKTDKVEDVLKETDSKYNSERLQYEIVGKENLEIMDHTVNVKENQGSITLRTNIPKNTELIVYLKNVRMNFQNGIDQFAVEAQCNNIRSQASLQQPENKFYWGQKDVLLSLGSKQTGEQIIKIIFSNKGKYQIEDFQVICHNMKDLEQQVAKLTDNQLENVDMNESNEISGDIRVDSEKILTFGIPFSSGWKVLVDGKEQELLKVNTMWSGVLLNKGEHKIELIYSTPGIKIGGVISVCALVGFLGYLIWRKKKSR